MLPYQIINLSTQIPFDKELSSRLEKITYINSLENLVNTRNQRPDGNIGIDIIFVCESDIDEYTTEDETDYLGVYIPHHHKYNREVILICPERILHAADSFKTKKEIKTPVQKIYSALLLNVVLHELAHALMAINRDKFDSRINWQNGLKDFACSNNSNSIGHERADLYNIAHGKIIEESLANAFSLIHFDGNEKVFLKSFISGESKPYRLGLNWKMNPLDLLETMDSWRNCKVTNTEWISEIYKLLNNKDEGPLMKIPSRLGGGCIVKTISFSDELVKYHLKEQSRWIKEIKASIDPKLNANINPKLNANKMIRTIKKGKKLNNIHKYIKVFDGVFDLSGIEITSHCLGFLRIRGLQYVYMDNHSVSEIINKYLPGDDIMSCMNELIDAGFEEYAKL